jgi:hypothetical protein
LNVKSDRLRFLGELLAGIGELMQKQEAKSEARKCAECGGSLALLDGRRERGIARRNVGKLPIASA